MKYILLICKDTEIQSKYRILPIFVFFFVLEKKIVLLQSRTAVAYICLFSGLHVSLQHVHASCSYRDTVDLESKRNSAILFCISIFFAINQNHPIYCDNGSLMFYFL